MGAEEAVKFIQKRRRCANPNPGFMRQLIKYENELPKTVKHNDVNNTTSEQVIKRDEAIRDAIKSIDEIKEELKPESTDLDFNYSDPLTTSFIKQDVEEYEQGTSFLKISNS